MKNYKRILLGTIFFADEESNAEQINVTPSDEEFKAEQIDNISTDIIEGNKVEKIATFSPEQFQQIIAAMGGSTRGGSFTQCTARYNGQRDPAGVEKFLPAISVYKDIEKN